MCMSFIDPYQCLLLLLFYFYFFKSTYPFIYMKWIALVEENLARKCFCWTDFLYKKKKKTKQNKNRLLIFQIKPIKPIKPSRSNCTAIGWKTDLNQYASVLIITKPIPIGLVTNLEKNQANRTTHTPTSKVTHIGDWFASWT